MRKILSIAAIGLAACVAMPQSVIAEDTGEQARRHGAAVAEQAGEELDETAPDYYQHYEKKWQNFVTKAGEKKAARAAGPPRSDYRPPDGSIDENIRREQDALQKSAIERRAREGERRHGGAAEDGP